jgi:hypothetical protein
VRYCHRVEAIGLVQVFVTADETRVVRRLHERACPDGAEVRQWNFGINSVAGSNIRRIAVRFQRLCCDIRAVDGLGIRTWPIPNGGCRTRCRLVRPCAKRVMAKASNVFALAWRNAGAAQDQLIAAFRDFALDEACGCELAAGPCGLPASEKDSRSRAGWMAGRATRRAMMRNRPALEARLRAAE